MWFSSRETIHAMHAADSTPIITDQLPLAVSSLMIHTLTPFFLFSTSYLASVTSRSVQLVSNFYFQIMN